MERDEKIRQFAKGQLSEKETDALLEDVLTEEMDTGLRQRISQKLKDEHGVTREQPAKSEGKLRYLPYMLAVAVSIVLLFTLTIFNGGNPQEMASGYLAGQEIMHPGSFKGVTDQEQERTLAIDAFNDARYGEAAGHFGKIATPNVEDDYYLGVAYLKDGQLDAAKDQLQKVGEQNTRFDQEANWFLALAYLLDEKEDEAADILKKIGTNEWKYGEAQELLDEIN